MHFFISFLAGIVIYRLFPYFPISSTLPALLISLVLLLKRQFIHILIIITGIITGISYAYIRSGPYILSHYYGYETIVKGVFESYPVKTSNDTYCQTFRIISINTEDSNQYLHELVEQEITLFSENEFEAGQEYELGIKFLKNRERLNPGEQLKDNLYATVTSIYNEGKKHNLLNSKILSCRNRINVYIEKHFSQDSAALISSITIGHRALIKEDLRDAFNKTGLAHILSISGTHFGLFSVLIFGTFRLIIKFLPYMVLQRITIFVTPAQASAIMSFPLMLTYLGLSGASIPAIRSFIMISLFLFGMLICRKGFWLNSLLFAAFIIALWNPGQIFTLSFQLSFIAVFFIGMFIENKKGEEKFKILTYVKNALFISISASIGIAPIVAYYFHYFSFISPITNLLITPIIGFIIIPLSVLSSFSYLISDYFIFSPLIEVLSRFSISLIRLFSEIRFAAIKIPNFPLALILFFYIGFLFYFFNNKRKFLLITPFVSFILYLSFSVFEKDKLNVTFLDVGQGDSAVIELPDGKTIVTDTGKTGKETAKFLYYRGKKTIDSLIISHIHPDHTGGLYYLLDRFDIREIWYNGRMIFPEIPDKLILRVLNRGDRIDGDGYSIYILHPYPEFYTLSNEEYDEANNDSLVFKIQGKYQSVLFTGDIEEEAEQNVVHLGEWIKSDVLKVPHHGSKSSAYQTFFKTVSPKIAIINCGRDNAFGHPHQEMIDALNGAEIFRTDIHGAIKITESRNGSETKTYRDFQFKHANSFWEELNNLKKLFQTW